MKKLLFLPLLSLMIIFSSCDLLNELIPDIEKDITKTFTITIEENVPAGVTDDIFIDVREYEEYQTYLQFIDGYAINKISYEILDFSAPEDLYFVGNVEAYESEVSSAVTLAQVASVNLSAVAALATEQEVAVDAAAVEQAIAWMTDPGSFNVRFAYELQQENGSEYVFTEEDFGSSFKVKVNISIAILTGGSEETE
jgi:hypothetical protein